jgi:hypothetical protein
MRSFTVVFIPVGLGLLERNRIVNKVENRTIIIKYIFCANFGICLVVGTCQTRAERERNPYLLDEAMTAPTPKPAGEISLLHTRTVNAGLSQM